MLREIREITDSNKQDMLGLEVELGQQRFIEPMEQSFKDAEDEEQFVPLGLYQDDVPVGFAMYGKFDDEVWFDRFLIDKKYQGQGLGAFFFREVLSFLNAKYEGYDLYLSVYEDNEPAIALYKKENFYFTGERDTKNEQIMKRDFQVNNEKYKKDGEYGDRSN